jgi:hypothetical protein
VEHQIDPATFEFLVHVLEVSVVIGIGVIIYITRKHSTELNRRLDERMKDEVDVSPRE